MFLHKSPRSLPSTQVYLVPSFTLYAIIYNSPSISEFLSPFCSHQLCKYMGIFKIPLDPRVELISVTHTHIHTQTAFPHIPVIILFKFMCYGSEFLIITEYFFEPHEYSLSAMQKLVKRSGTRPCRRSLKAGTRSKMQHWRLWWRREASSGGTLGFYSYKDGLSLTRARCHAEASLPTCSRRVWLMFLYFRIVISLLWNGFKHTNNKNIQQLGLLHYPGST